jgi:hypothetical protein
LVDGMYLSIPSYQQSDMVSTEGGRMPVSLLIDRNGEIRYQHFGESMSIIPENQQIISLLDELNKEDAGVA